MRKQHAIKLIERQRDSFNEDTAKSYNWFSQTDELLLKILGPESPIIRNFHSFKPLDIKRPQDEKNTYMQRMRTCLESCIQTVKDIGVYKPPGIGNYLSRLSDTWLTTLIAGAATVIFYAGVWYGESKDTASRLRELEAENKKLKELPPIIDTLTPAKVSPKE